MLIQRFSDIKNQNIKKQAFGNFLDDFGLEVPSSDEEDKDPDEYLIKTLKEYRIVEELDRKFSEKEDLFYINKSENELKQEVIYEKPCY